MTKLSMACALLFASGCLRSVTVGSNTDAGSTQCTTDADCETLLGSHPSCQSGVCVPSGFGPSGCFLGTPQAQSDFANQCTTAVCTPFDNCGRLGLCDAGADAEEEVDGGGVFAVTSSPVSQGTTPPPINTETEPTIPCVDPSRPNLIYMTGSTSFPPLIQAVQPLLSAASPSYTVIYLPQTSCEGAASIYSTTLQLITNITGNWAYFYDANGNQTYCLLDPAGDAVDVGESDVFPSSCGFSETPGIDDYIGPAQAITFVVPSGSSQTSISAEEAHLVFGAGGDDGRTPPWTNPQYYFTLSSDTGTTILPSYAIDVAPTQWWGIDRLSAGNLRDSMESVAPFYMEQAIGVLSSNYADSSRANLRELSFQEVGEPCGYLPDSTAETFDKENVRDGHYLIWGTVHLLAPTANGVPSQAAGVLLNSLTVPKLDQGLVAAIAQAGFIPACAMRVSRTTEMGPLSTYLPQFGCSCFYESVAGNAPSTCLNCSAASDCPASTPACNYGFCGIQ